MSERDLDDSQVPYRCHTSSTIGILVTFLDIAMTYDDYRSLFVFELVRIYQFVFVQRKDA